MPSAPALPRGLILLASLWLFLSWIGSMGVHPPLLVATSSYTPSVRLMMLSSAVGALVAWPLLRLSAARTHAPVRAVLLDLAVVLGMLNMVLWPLRLVTPWPVARMAVLMLILAAWIACVAGIVSIGWGSRRGWVRAAAMIAVLAISIGAIGIRAIAPTALAPFPWALAGPVEAILTMTTPGGAPPLTSERAALEISVAAALAAWSAALVVSAVRRRSGASSGGLPRTRPADTLAAWN